MSLSLSSVQNGKALVIFDSARPAGSRAVCSIVAQLNNYNAPALRGLRGIVDGRSIEEAVLRVESFRSAVSLFPIYRKAGQSEREAAESAFLSSGMPLYLESDVAELLAVVTAKTADTSGANLSGSELAWVQSDDNMERVEVTSEIHVVVRLPADHAPIEPTHIDYDNELMRGKCILAARELRTGRYGSFAASIGDAFSLADSKNAEKLVAAFPDIFRRAFPF